MTGVEHAYLEVAEKAVKKAGKYLLSIKKDKIEVIEENRRDIKLKVDRNSEDIIVKELRKNTEFPILTEEKGFIDKNNHQEQKDRYLWIVDPLDGSVNFSKNIPICCVSIALWKNDEPLVGVVFDFNHNEFFSGIVGYGAWLNEKSIKVSNVKSKQEAVLCTGFPVSFNFASGSLSNFIKDIQEYKKIRLLGSAALSLAYVAYGRADVYKENNIKIWDVAAGITIVKAAGGLIQYKGFPESYLVDAFASNTSLFIK